MPLKICVALLIAAAFVVGCSQNGTVVEKRLRPSPFAYSAGVDAIYSFLLRDSQGQVHSQMVSGDVFERYEVGDYFSDQQPGPGVRRERGYGKDSDVSDSKTVRPASHAALHRKHHSKATARHKKHRKGRAIVRHRDDGVRRKTVAAVELQPFDVRR